MPLPNPALALHHTPTSAAPPPPPSRKALQILDAATELFLGEGFDGVSMDRVTQAAGVSKATLYVHFRTKQELFTGVILREVEAVRRLTTIRLTDATDIASALRAIAHHLAAFFVSERMVKLKRAAIGAIAHFPELAAVIFRAGPGETIITLAQHLAEHGATQGLTIPDPNLAARQFLNLVCGDFEFGGVLPAPPLSEADVNHVIEEAIAMFFARYRSTEVAR
ncbi:TetR/AcrR family transcriptional regulator [Bosea sp. (in: a-proteobacteria)]|uniref:TetR/AcrR family transcriptional regulator n=1 Tax=Bosea sp. (in: a-proteobacteria) TaxID=1871050 RepID=UPI000AE76730|nr:TetR/AcrR family transcriptional regulator [Bosea sp. (in: a-proteobacteria)]WRH57589.1 MAG: TetR/AcrR family transcriptional regulator [Bosea sp. (in: a-proteobacteria)]